MDYYFKKNKNNSGEYIEITQFKPGISHVRILDEIDGVPVTDISQRALLSASHINHFTVYLGDNDFSLARYILRETVQTLRISFILSEGELELTFPGFVSKTVEDTMARAIHTKIQGSGYAYRECVFRDRIDTTSYDALFPRALAEPFDTCTDIALARLMHPLRLTEEKSLMYSNFITENAWDVCKHLLLSGDSARVSFFFNRFNPDKKLYMDALALCAENNLAALTPIIMQSHIK